MPLRPNPLSLKRIPMSRASDQLPQILRTAMDLEGQARADYLDLACAGDSDLRREVNSLLAKVQAATDETDPPAPNAQNFAAAREIEHVRERRDRRGARIGPFRVLEKLGEGGMGEVWLAERVDGGFAQQVAIKWLTLGLRASAVARFEQERAILARLDHPGIVRILDGGSSDGELWFAMDRVVGEPLDRFIEKTHPSLAASLDLLIQTCAAVHFAHQHLIVHRDLKPSNILVDADGQVRLVDFGVAKALDSTDPLTAQTRAPLTHAYAAPEQIAGQGVSTATDVYALGVVLYELLAGERPAAGREKGALSLAQILTDIQPAPPSAVHARGANAKPRWTARALKGDLDTIAIKALAREPQRRYASAQALGEDLRRHLHGEPIDARPDSWGYRLGKLVRRHPFGTLLTVAGLLALVAMTAVSIGQAKRANEQAESALLQARQAEAVSGHLSAVLSRAQAAGPSVSTEVLLDWAADPLISGRYEDPAMNRALQLAVSDLVLGRNDFSRTLEVLDPLQAELLHASVREQLQAGANRTRALMRLGLLDQAQASLRQTSALLPAEPIGMAMQLKIYEGEIARLKGHPDEAIEAALVAVSLGPRVRDFSALTIGTLYASAAVGLLQNGALDDAARVADLALEVWRNGAVSNNISRPTVEAIGANALFLRGHILEALKRFAAIAVDPGESAPPRAARTTGHAKALVLANQASAGLALIDQAIEEICGAAGPAGPDCISMLLAGADAAQIAGAWPLAEQRMAWAQTLLESTPLPPLSQAITRFRQRAQALTDPTDANVASLLEALLQPNLSGIAQRNTVRSLLVSAETLASQGHGRAAESFAHAALSAAIGMPAEQGGLDQSLLSIWRANLDAQAPQRGDVDALAVAIGADHPWVRAIRNSSGK